MKTFMKLYDNDNDDDDDDESNEDDDQMVCKPLFMTSYIQVSTHTHTCIAFPV